MSSQPANLEQLVREIAYQIGATEAAAFAVDPDFFEGHSINALLHVREDNSDHAVREAAVEAFKEIVSPHVRQAKDGAIEVGADNGHGKQFCIVTLARREPQVVGAAAFIVRCRNFDIARCVLWRVQCAVRGV